MKRILSMLAAASLLGGCVSVGTNYRPADVERLQVGMTKADVIKVLGQPNDATSFGDGSQKLIWNYATGSMFGTSGHWVALPFDKDGRLTQVPKNVPK